MIDYDHLVVVVLLSLSCCGNLVVVVLLLSCCCLVDVDTASVTGDDGRNQMRRFI